MNERIKQLAEQAKRYAEDEQNDPLKIYTLDRFNEKFAELIVRECLSQVDKIRDGMEADGVDEQALGADWAGLAIAQHFGVEECL